MKSQDKSIFRAASLACVLLASAGAFAQTASGDVKPSHGDLSFVNDAAMSGVAEIGLSQIALKNANSDQVKQYAQHMVDDHQKANAELMQITNGKGIPAPTDMGSGHKKMAQKLSGVTGADFDTQYMKGMLVDHKKVVALFTKEAKSGTDPDLKAFAAKNLPALQQHLQMAQSLQTASSGTSTGTNTRTGTSTGPGAAGFADMNGGTTKGGAR